MEWRLAEWLSGCQFSSVNCNMLVKFVTAGMEHHGQMLIYIFLFGVMACPLLFQDVDVLL